LKVFGYDKIVIMKNPRGLFIYTLGLVLILLFAIFVTPLTKASADDNLSGWGWSSTVGWISFNCTNTNSCGASNYGVTVSGSGILSGYAWSPNIGWISFNESQLGGCPSGTCKAEFDSAGGGVSGWARACAGTLGGNCTGGNRTDGWEGWISLAGSSYGVNASACNWQGFAWGGSVVGWLSFSSLNDHDPNTSGVQQSAVDYGVTGSGSACLNDPEPECSDDVDNDDPEDTLKDIQDPGCYDTGAYSINDTDETDTLPQCSNNFDDDGDGEFDENEPGCYDTGGYNPNDTSETETLPDCANFFDDDGDGKIDAGDPGCYDTGAYSAGDSSEVDTLPQCSNNFDDDADGFIDLSDFGCSDGNDISEGDPECADFDTDGNPIDNDGDGLANENDPGCWTDPTDPTTYDLSRDQEKRIRIREVLPE
jgi:hypothetical protein